MNFQAPTDSDTAQLAFGRQNRGDPSAQCAPAEDPPAAAAPPSRRDGSAKSGKTIAGRTLFPATEL